MEKVPKLFPSWHSVTMRDTAEKFRSSLLMHYYPDHGGAGIDVNYVDGDLQCEELKSAVNKVCFKAEACALPLLPPNKVDSLFDPCMEQLLKDKEKEEQFFYKALGTHSAMKRFPTVRDNIMRASRKTSKYAGKGKFNKIKVPPAIYELAKNFPKHIPNPRARWLYTGGCLTALKSTAAEQYLLHPVGRKLNCLAITPLKESSDNPFGVYADVENQEMITLPDGCKRIFQVSVPTAPLSSAADCCCVRNRKTYHYIWLKANEKDTDSFCMESYNFDYHLSDIKLSNYIPGEHIVVTNNGDLFLQDAELKKTVWQTAECLSHDPVVTESWWGCDFGSHPRSVLYADRSQFTALDLRAKGTQGLKIVSIPNPFFQEISEQILLTRQLDVNSFQHFVASDIHMFVFDERYPQQPMITWSHMLESVPLYCDVKCYSSDSNSSELIVLLGSQNAQDIAAFHISCNLSRIQPLSLTHPIHVSSPRDCTRNLELQCISVHDEVLKRTSAPLIGVSAVPYARNIGYSVLQLTSFGDVFHQEFFLSENGTDDEKTFRVEPGCTLVPASKIQSSMSSWLEKAVVSKEKRAKRSSKRDVLTMFADREQVVSDILSTKRAKSCAICEPFTGRLDSGEENDEDVYSDICPRCGLYVEYGQQLTDTYKNFGVLAGYLPACPEIDEDSSPKDLKLMDLDEIIDPLAKMVLEEWPERQQSRSDATGQWLTENTMDTFASIQRESFEMLSPQNMSPQKQKVTEAPYTCPSDFRRTYSSTLDNSFNPSQDLFPFQTMDSPVPVKHQSKKIKLSSSFGF